MPHLLRSLSLAAAFAVVIFGIPAIASAASYFVAPNGGGSTCSSASPCALNEGLSKAGGGDEVVLKDGNYTQGTNVIKTVRSGTASAPITIRAENRHRAIIKLGEHATGSLWQAQKVVRP